ncbi:putative bifunctional diguanylate cyclase/phosphodiesterase [Salipaludibacillus sp. CF4.18]|uniref:putative bifunctional diguanylate cyclase/phosphodiesterase n=1 Tax=Salipaludibacillus sp. CF4.18 TaxID=3373081 RepID=UPI003EE57BC4
MMTKKQSGALLITIIITLFYVWNYLFKENEWMGALGASSIPFIGGTLSLIWLYQAYRKNRTTQRYFWLLLIFGVFLNISGNLIWTLGIITIGDTTYPDISWLLWLLAYIFYLAALIYKTKIINGFGANNPYLFNITVFMLIASVISIHYFIEPLIVIQSNSFLMTIINIGFQISNLSIAFVVMYLYYLARHSIEKKLIQIIIIAFSVRLIADTGYTFISIHGTYEIGGFIEPLWVFAVMLMGFASFFEQEHAYNNIQTKSYVKEKEPIFPYISAVILIVLVAQSYQWELNALSIGISIIFFMIIIRHLSIIKKNKNLMSEYRNLAFHDSLTGLNNRTSFHHDLGLQMGNAKQIDSTVALLLIDLDQFKLVNDTLGHQIGDQLLKLASVRLQCSTGNDAEIYRIGGDEFVIILSDATEENCIKVARKILKEFSKSFSVAGHEMTVTASIGISLYPEHGEDRESLLKNADAAMYLAKGNGRNKFRFYNSKLNEIMVRKMKIDSELRKAMENNEFHLVYQPKINLQSREIIGMEALLRWNSTELGSVSPVEFISIAEETGQIVAIGEWVLETACKQNKRWQEAGFPLLCVSVNVSVRQFQQNAFLETVKGVLQNTGLEPQFLELEITESVMQNKAESTELLKGLRKIGVKTSIDDFGTGYSSLNILRELPIDTIKIDKSFIDGILDSASESMIKTIMDIGLNLNLEVIAEGIEHECQVEMLEKYNCRFGQGYLFLKPTDRAGFEKYLETYTAQTSLN